MNIIQPILQASPPKVQPGKTIWQYLQVLIDVGDIPDELKKNRPPLNLSLVLDRSGSMQGSSLDYTRQSAVKFVENLSPKDFISVVIYDDTIEPLIPAMSVPQDKSVIIDSINQIEARGSTDLYSGLKEGIKQVRTFYSTNITNRVLLFSDGLANVGRTDPAEIAQRIKQKLQDTSISVSTLGMGADFNEILMQNLSQQTHGNYYYIETPEYIPTLVSRELQGLSTLVWKNLEIGFDGAPNFHIKEILGYNVKDNQNFIGEVRALDELYIIAKYPIPSKIVLPATLKVTLRYDDVLQKLDSQEKELTFSVEYTDDDSELSEDIAIRANLELFALGNDIESARQLMEKEDFKGAGEVLEKRIMIMKSLKEVIPTDTRLDLKITFLEMMLERAKKRAYDQKFGKMSSYYSYSSTKSRFRTKIT